MIIRFIILDNYKFFIIFSIGIVMSFNDYKWVGDMLWDVNIVMDKVKV